MHACCAWPGCLQSSRTAAAVRGCWLVVHSKPERPRLHASVRCHVGQALSARHSTLTFSRGGRSTCFLCPSNNAPTTGACAERSFVHAGVIPMLAAPVPGNSDVMLEVSLCHSFCCRLHMLVNVPRFTSLDSLNGPALLLKFALTAWPSASVWDQCSLCNLTAVCGACRRL